MEKTDCRYNKRQYRGVKFDLYRFMDLFNITHPAHQHAVKKLARAGQGSKPLNQDLLEVIEAIERWLEMMTEDNLTLEGEVKELTERLEYLRAKAKHVQRQDTLLEVLDEEASSNFTRY